MSLVTLKVPGATVSYGGAFQIQLRAASPAGASDVRTRHGASVPSKDCIVIVEPNDLMRELLERWLGEAGFDVIPAAKDLVLPVAKPRLVITDISDPATAGNTIEALRAAYAAPILALSARFRRGLGGSSEAAQRLHVRKVLPKPFTRQQLLRAVRESLKQR